MIEYSYSGIGIPDVQVLIYPYSGSKIEITPDIFPLKELRVTNSVRGASTFQMALAPSPIPGEAPNLTLPQMIPPMSLVVIYMARGEHKYPVLIGVVSNTEEEQIWGGKNAERTITISGSDMTYFFTTFSYFTLSWLGSMAENISAASFPKIIAKMSTSTLSPQEAGKEFYDGAFKPYLEYTQFWKAGSYIKLPELLETRFGPFASESNLFIPLVLSFLSSNGNWMQKFNQVFPFPLYETFVMTYEDKDASNYPAVHTSGTQLDIKDQAAKSGFIARELPFPKMRAPLSNTDAPALERKLWDSLEEYVIDDSTFIQSTASWSVAGVRNLFRLDPYIITSALQNDGSKGVAALLLALKGIGVDTNSIHRYGMLPEVFSTIWFADTYDQKNANAHNTTQDELQTLVWEIVYRLQSYYGPIPLFLNAAIQVPLSPDILPGNKLTYSPFKNGEKWTFYIEDVEHSYVFGGASYSTFRLTRGLPTTVYNDSSLLLALLEGRVERKDGTYQLIPFVDWGSSFNTFGYKELQAVFDDLIPAFYKPQGGK